MHITHTCKHHRHSHMIDIGHAHRGSAFRDQGWNIQLYAADGVCVPAPLRGWHMKTPMPFHLAAPRLSQARPHHPPGIGRWKGDRFGCQATYRSYKHTHTRSGSAHLSYRLRVQAARLGRTKSAVHLQCVRASADKHGCADALQVRTDRFEF